MFFARFWLQCIPLVFAVGCFDFLDKSDDDDDDDDWGDEGGADVYGPDGGVDGGGGSGSTADAGAVEDDTGSSDDDLDADESGDVVDMPGDECDDGLGVRDCDIECWVAAALNYLGDGICDVGDRGPNFDCAEFDADEGDCIEDTGAVSVDDADGGADDEEGPDSCSFGESICVEPNEPDNEAWCSSLGSWAEYFDEPCPDGFYGTCAIPAGGDYTAEATAYYYGDDLDGESACASSGGTYTATGGGTPAGASGGGAAGGGGTVGGGTDAGGTSGGGTSGGGTSGGGTTTGGGTSGGGTTTGGATTGGGTSGGGTTTGGGTTGGVSYPSIPAGDCDFYGSVGVYDCLAEACLPVSWLGDSACDAALDCAASEWDAGDCDADTDSEPDDSDLPSGYIEDCYGSVAIASELGDGICDWSFDCAEHAYDAGDCLDGGATTGGTTTGGTTTGGTTTGGGTTGGTTTGGGTTGGTTTGGGTTGGGTSGGGTSGGGTSGGGTSGGGTTGGGTTGGSIPSDIPDGAVGCWTDDDWRIPDDGGAIVYIDRGTPGYLDCTDTCVPGAFFTASYRWFGDGMCDDGSAVGIYDPVDLDCETWEYDGGDCVDGGSESAGSTTGGGTDGGGTTGGSTSDGGTGVPGGLTYLDGVVPESGPGSDCTMTEPDMVGFTGSETCSGVCILLSLDPGGWFSGMTGHIGDGYCDDGSGSPSYLDLYCAFFLFDDGDCSAAGVEVSVE